MKGLCSLLVQLAVVGIPISLGLGIIIGTERVLGWPKPWPWVSGIGFVGMLIGGAFWWMVAVQKRENQTTGILTDVVFGKVGQKKASWEAKVKFVPTGERIVVYSFEGNSPTDRQRETFEQILGTWDQVLPQIEDALDAFGEGGVEPARPRQLKIDSIGLDARENAWSIEFDVSGSEAPWGFSADFREGTLELLEDLH